MVCPQCYTEPKRRLTGHGICYLMEFMDFKDAFLQKGYYFYFITQSNDSMSFDWLDKENEDYKYAMLFLGNDVSEYLPSDYVPVYFNRTLKIRYTAILHRRMSTSDYPCFRVEVALA